MKRILYRFPTLLLLLFCLVVVWPITIATADTTADAVTVGFQDVTAQSTIGAGAWGASAGGHAVVWGDVTGDGLPDLYLPYQGRTAPHKDRFYRNLGWGRFVEEGAPRGISDPDGGSHGAGWADLDNDGDLDLINGSTSAWGAQPAANDLYRNSGTGWFSAATPATLAQRKEATRAFLAFDMDRDGDQDLFAVSGYEGSVDAADERNEIYRNDGGWQFTAVTWGALFDAPAGQGAIATDFDNDGDLDVLASNRSGRMHILRNGGWGNFAAVDPFALGLQHAWFEGGDGINTADIDNDGDLDLLMATDGNAQLFINNGWGQFWLKQRWDGIAGYMGGFADLDNDTDLDLVFPGHASIYLNDGKGNYTTKVWAPMNGSNDPRSVAFADYDNDGDLDFAIADKKIPNRLIRTDNWSDNHWLKIDLISPSGERGALGAKVRVYPQHTKWPQLGLREAVSNRGYLAQDDPVLHFGLAKHETVDVEVRFLNGKTVWLSGVSADQTLIVDGRK